jgi:NIMA (never in mitosis gene a)-related kinase
MGGLDEYELLCKVGQGAFGSVFKAKRHADGAVKVLKMMPVVGLSRREQEDALNEVRILASLKSEYVVSYDDSFMAGDSLAIVMEYCARGDLHHALAARNGKLLPEPQVWRYLLHTLLGLHYVHSQRILHRDLKTMNLFLSEHDTVRIGDFGVARLMGTHTHFAKTMVGTPYYLSPELCENRPYNDKSDMWALGCILYELCTLTHPFDASNHGALILKILRGRYPPPSAEYSRPLRELVGLLLARRSERRPSAAALLAHPAICAKAQELGIATPRDLPSGAQQPPRAPPS